VNNAGITRRNAFSADVDTVAKDWQDILGIWIYLNAALAAVLLAVLWWERGKSASPRPSLICMATALVTTTISYIGMSDICFG
jgi:hypothetical protein